MAKPSKNPTKTKISNRSSLKTPLITNNAEIKADNVNESFLGKTNNKKANFFDGTRDWLNTNKIFFETIAAFSLTVMAIALAWGQLQVTQDQTTYLEQQTTIEREMALPHFVVVTETVANLETGSHDDDKIFIRNFGNIAFNVKADTAVFFKLSYLNKANSQEVLVPVQGYYWWYVYSGDVTGLVMTIEQKGNNAKRSAIQDDIEKLITEPTEILNLEIRRYVVITYQDIFDTTHTEYYLVAPFSTGQLIDPEEGKSMFVQFKNGGTSGITFDLDKLTAQDIYNLFR